MTRKHGSSKTISASFKGLDAAIKAAGDLGPDVRDAAYKAVAETAADGERVIKQIHRDAGAGASGRLYRKGKTVVHRASSSRNPPAPDTGTLLGSIFHSKIRAGNWFVGSRLKYAFWLEWGTEHMKPRPLWRPGAKIIQKRLNKNVNDAIRKVLK